VDHPAGTGNFPYTVELSITASDGEVIDESYQGIICVAGNGQESPISYGWSLSVLDHVIAGQLVRGSGGPQAPDDFGTFQLLGDGQTDNSARRPVQARVETTAIYTQVAIRQLKAASEATHPRRHEAEDDPRQPGCVGSDG
jgi:hypothetical protein